MSWAIPAAAGTLGAAGTLRGARSDANLLTGQAETSVRQANRDEEAQRREGRQHLGRMAAAMAQAGGGVDEKALEQSSTAMELDALNIRYAGQMRAQGLLAEARSIRKQSKLLAGANLLQGAASSYSMYKQGK
jgi:hypothetical protein